MDTKLVIDILKQSINRFTRQQSLPKLVKILKSIGNGKILVENEKESKITDFFLNQFQNSVSNDSELSFCINVLFTVLIHIGGQKKLITAAYEFIDRNGTKKPFVTFCHGVIIFTKEMSIQNCSRTISSCLVILKLIHDKLMIKIQNKIIPAKTTEEETKSLLFALKAVYQVLRGQENFDNSLEQDFYLLLDFLDANSSTNHGVLIVEFLDYLLEITPFSENAIKKSLNLSYNILDIIHEKIIRPNDFEALFAFPVQLYELGVKALAFTTLSSAVLSNILSRSYKRSNKKYTINVEKLNFEPLLIILGSTIDNFPPEKKVERMFKTQKMNLKAAPMPNPIFFDGKNFIKRLQKVFAALVCTIGLERCLHTLPILPKIQSEETKIRIPKTRLWIFKTFKAVIAFAFETEMSSRGSFALESTEMEKRGKLILDLNFFVSELLPMANSAMTDCTPIDFSSCRDEKSPAFNFAMAVFEALPAFCADLGGNFKEKQQRLAVLEEIILPIFDDLVNKKSFKLISTIVKAIAIIPKSIFVTTEQKLKNYKNWQNSQDAKRYIKSVYKSQKSKRGLSQNPVTQQNFLINVKKNLIWENTDLASFVLGFQTLREIYVDYEEHFKVDNRKDFRAFSVKVFPILIKSIFYFKSSGFHPFVDAIKIYSKNLPDEEVEAYIRDSVKCSNIVIPAIEFSLIHALFERRFYSKNLIDFVTAFIFDDVLDKQKNYNQGLKLLRVFMTHQNKWNMENIPLLKKVLSYKTTSSTSIKAKMKCFSFIFESLEYLPEHVLADFINIAFPVSFLAIKAQGKKSRTASINFFKTIAHSEAGQRLGAYKLFNFCFQIMRKSGLLSKSGALEGITLIFLERHHTLGMSEKHSLFKNVIELLISRRGTARLKEEAKSVLVFFKAFISRVPKDELEPLLPQIIFIVNRMIEPDLSIDENVEDSFLQPAPSFKKNNPKNIIQNEAKSVLKNSIKSKSKIITSFEKIKTERKGDVVSSLNLGIMKKEKITPKKIWEIQKTQKKLNCLGKLDKTKKISKDARKISKSKTAALKLEKMNPFWKDYGQNGVNPRRFGWKVLPKFPFRVKAKLILEKLVKKFSQARIIDYLTPTGQIILRNVVRRIFKRKKKNNFRLKCDNCSIGFKEESGFYKDTGDFDFKSDSAYSESDYEEMCLTTKKEKKRLKVKNPRAGRVGQLDGLFKDVPRSKKYTKLSKIVNAKRIRQLRISKFRGKNMKHKSKKSRHYHVAGKLARDKSRENRSARFIASNPFRSVFTPLNMKNFRK